MTPRGQGWGGGWGRSLLSFLQRGCLRETSRRGKERKVNDKVEEGWEFQAEKSVYAKALWLKEPVKYREPRGNSLSGTEGCEW